MKRLRVLVGCEVSGVVRRAFRALGHDAWSCDLQPAADGGEHYQDDILAVLKFSKPWDLGIFHPVCKRLANSGVLRLYKGGKKRNGVDWSKWMEMCQGVNNFAAMWKAAEVIPAVCFENPIQHRWARTLLAKAGVPSWTQTVQPFEFGDPESKRTCLWLRGLPRLRHTNVLPLPACGYWANQTPSGQNKLGPSTARGAIRAVTYDGIAQAFASQWSDFLCGKQQTKG